MYEFIYGAYCKDTNITLIQINPNSDQTKCPRDEMTTYGSKLMHERSKHYIVIRLLKWYRFQEPF